MTVITPPTKKHPKVLDEAQRTSVQKSSSPAPYQRIKEACRSTGLSAYFLRKGCRDNSVPHVRSGNTYYINVPALLELLSNKSQPEQESDYEGMIIRALVRTEGPD